MPILASITSTGEKNCRGPRYPGHFGENLTTEGLLEHTLCVGDRLRVGSALLMVTQPRMPCYKLALRFERDDMIQRFLASGRSGFYFSVIEAGEVRAGSEIEVVSRDENAVTVADIGQLYLGQTGDSDLLQRALSLSALPTNWRDALQQRAEANSEWGVHKRQ